MIKGRDVLAYILGKAGCLHPFTASRVAALSELFYMGERGGRLTDLVYVAGPGVFYIEGFKELVEGDSCFEKREGDPSTGRRGCIKYNCPPPTLSVEITRFLDEAIEKAKHLDDSSLNNAVISHPLYPRLTASK